MTATTTTDQIEKQVLLRAKRPRVWRALSDSAEFGRWFQARFSGPFQAGATVTARMTYPGYEHVVMELTVVELEPERRLAFRWHPAAAMPGVDFSSEPTTLVTFTLEDAEGGTRLTLVESGFDRLPVARRAAAFKANEGGWAIQLEAIEAHLGREP